MTTALPYDVGIENQTIKTSCGHSEVAFQHDYNECKPYQSKWDEKKNVDVGTLHALRCSKSKTKIRLAGSTQDSTAVESTPLVLFIQTYCPQACSSQMDSLCGLLLHQNSLQSKIELDDGLTEC